MVHGTPAGTGSWWAVAAGVGILSACSGENVGPPAGAPTTRAECLQQAVFPEPSTSAYCLPFATGSSYSVSQAYCSPPPGSHQTRFAWDFDMPVGTEILATRAGVVVELREHFSDNDPQGGHENMVSLRHDDQTISLYIHLRQNGVLVEMGDTVPRGSLLGWGGASGTTVPHLHFMVCLRGGICSSPNEFTIPVSFRNAIGPLDANGGLSAGTTYTAASCN